MAAETRLVQSVSSHSILVQRLLQRDRSVMSNCDFCTNLLLFHAMQKNEIGPTSVLLSGVPTTTVATGPCSKCTASLREHNRTGWYSIVQIQARTWTVLTLG